MPDIIPHFFKMIAPTQIYGTENMIPCEIYS